MKQIKLHDKVFVPFIENEKVEKAIQKLADRLNADFKDSGEVPVFLCILNGAMMFTTSLISKLDFNLELASMRLSSYTGTQSGTMKMPMGVTTDIKGRTVVITEDIVDSGKTMLFLQEYFKDMGAKEIKVCTMLLKPEVFQNKMKLDYVAMEIPNRFIVGFGLDYNELGRNYKDIYVLKED